MPPPVVRVPKYIGRGAFLDVPAYTGNASKALVVNGAGNGFEYVAVALASHAHDAADITSGTIADARIASTITRDNEVMPIMLAADGSGSGLDADLLRGVTPSVYGLTLIDDADAATARATLGLGALATAGVPGSTTQVIFNNAGALAGDAGMTYDATNDALTVAGRVVTGAIRAATAATNGLEVQTPAGTALLTIDTSGARPKWGIGKSTGLVESFEVQSEPDYTTDSFGIRSTFSLAQTSNRTIEHYSALLAQSIIPSGNSFQPGAWSSAVYAYVRHDGGGTTPDLRTVIAVSRVNSTATVTAMTGFYSDVQLNSTAAIGSFYHFRANPLVKNGTNTVTNEYGFYAGNLTSGTNNYAFYSAGAKSHFANTDFSGTVELNSGSQLLLDGASAAAPSFCFVQTNLGMFRPVANVLGFSVGGAEKMRINLAGFIGLGTTSPTALLHLAASTAIRAQLRFDPTSAADPQTPNDGDVWYNSRLKLYRSSTTEIVPSAPQQSAYTQTYSTAARTVSAYTTDAESSAYTGIDNAQGGSVYAQLIDLNSLRTAYENLRTSYDGLIKVVNALIDDHQAFGIAG